MPSGEAGVMIFNADYHVLQYCDGTNWMRVGGSSEDARIGTLTAGKWCAANGGGTGLDCTQDAPVSAVTLTGDVTGTGSGSVATTIANGVVTYAKIQNTTADSVLLGRGAGAGAGTVQELTLGAGLALTGTVLSATATPTTAAGSASEVQFRNSSTGAFDADTGFAYDKTNHRLGVGIAAPAEKLQVQFGNVALSNAYRLKWGSSDIYGYDGAGGYINLRANGSQNLYLQDGGSVGVGTTSPAASSLLDLTSTAKGFLAPRMTTAQRDAIASPANGLVVYNTTTNVLNFWDGTAWQVVGTGGAANVLNNTTIDSGPFPQAAGSVVVPANGSYNLGSMPVEKGVYFFTIYNCNGQLSYSTGQGNTIDVVGPTILTSSSTWAQLNNVPYSSCGIFFSGIFKSSGTGTASVRVQSYQGSVLVTPGPSGASFSLRGWKISGGYDASGGGGGGGGSVNLTGDVTGGGTGSIATTIANGAVSYAKLQNTSAASVLLGRGAGAGAGAVQELTLGTGLSLAGTVLSATATPATAAGSANEVQFRNNSTGALDADSGFVYDKTSHRLGIGTASPDVPLKINHAGSAVAIAIGDLTTPASDTGIYFRTTGNANIMHANGGRFVFQDASNNVHMVIDGSGKVGIGTATPGALLTLANASAPNGSATMLQRIDVGADGTLGPVSLIMGAFPSATAASRFGFIGAGDNTAMRPLILNTNGTGGFGSVGIGTTTPASLFHVSSPYTTILTVSGANSGYVNAGIVLKSTSDTNYRGSGIFMHDAGGQNEWFAGRPYADSDNYIIARRASQAVHDEGVAQTTNTLMMVSASGNVGIGKTAPAAKLDVNGTVAATQYNGLSSTNNFQRITATARADVASSYNYSSTVSCPANYTIVNWGLQSCHTAGNYGSTNQPSYCDCSLSGNGIMASYWAPIVNTNFSATCFGLCVRN